MCVYILACYMQWVGLLCVVVEERARPASMERSSIVPSFAWMERLHYALARLALFPLLSSDTLPRDAGGAGKLPERKQTNPYAVRAGGRRIRRCMCVWRISTESRMCIATGKSMPGWTLEVQQRMNVTTPLHRRSGRSRRVVWLVRMVVAVLRARYGCGLVVGDLHEPVRG